VSDDNPFAASQSGVSVRATGVDVGISVGLALAMLAAGGYLCGWAIEEFGSFGAISLWATGAIAGFVAAKLIKPNKVAGYVLASGVVITFVVAEVYWIHWNYVGAEDWPTAVGMFPRFLREFKTDALIGGLFTFFGAASVYRQAGQRYRYIQVVDA